MVVQDSNLLLNLREFTKPVILAKNGHCYVCFKPDSERYSYHCWECNRYVPVGYDMSDEELNLVRMMRTTLVDLGEEYSGFKEARELLGKPLAALLLHCAMLAE